MKNLFKHTICIYYEDTDSTGHVYHAAYLKFAERGRTEMLKKVLKNKINDSKYSHSFFVVSKLNIVYKKPLKLFDKIEVCTKFTSIKNVTLNLDQYISKDNKIFSSLSVKLAYVNKHTGKPEKIESDLLTSLSKIKIV
tara:strand:- start:1516 stop:1929 length:414 start_codon:yes stop_codon:yes gene_type:complete